VAASKAVDGIAKKPLTMLGKDSIAAEKISEEPILSTLTMPSGSNFRAKLPTKPPLVGRTTTRSPNSTILAPGVKPGKYVYVQDANGVVHIAPNAPSAHPAVLGEGQPAAAAGEIVIGPDNIVIEINNISYSFQHDAQVLPLVRNAIEQQGLTVAPNALKPFQH
jgi:hypothetical protein